MSEENRENLNLFDFDHIFIDMFISPYMDDFKLTKDSAGIIC